MENRAGGHLGGFRRCSIGRTPGGFDDGLGRRAREESLGKSPAFD